MSSAGVGLEVAIERLTRATCAFPEHIGRDGVGTCRVRHDDLTLLLGEIERRAAPRTPATTGEGEVAGKTPEQIAAGIAFNAFGVWWNAYARDYPNAAWSVSEWQEVAFKAGVRAALAALPPSSGCKGWKLVPTDLEPPSEAAEIGAVRKHEWDACETTQDTYDLFRRQWKRAVDASPDLSALKGEV